MNNQVYYNPDQDRSEESGWTKLCDESVPTEAEQDLWAAITIITTLILGVSALLVG